MTDRKHEMTEGRFKVIREPYGYSVIDVKLDRADRRVAEFTGRSARVRAWTFARRCNREA